MTSAIAMRSFNWVFVLVVMLVMWAPVTRGDGEALGASFIFGDSLVDAGNNNYISTLSKANIAPNGIDLKASGGNPTGRYTNGRTIGDIVGECLAFCFFDNAKSGSSPSSIE